MEDDLRLNAKQKSPEKALNHFPIQDNNGRASRNASQQRAPPSVVLVISPHPNLAARAKH